MSEWSNETVLKTVIWVTISGVRIPSSPDYIHRFEEMVETLLGNIITDILDGKSLGNILLCALALVIIILVYRWIRHYIEYRKTVFESIRYTLKQAISHQNPKQDLSYVLQAHKDQQIRDITEKNSKLLRIDPLKRKIIHYTEELSCVASFEKSEKITKEFLRSCKSRY